MNTSSKQEPSATAISIGVNEPCNRRDQRYSIVFVTAYPRVDRYQCCRKALRVASLTHSMATSSLFRWAVKETNNE